MNDSSESCVTSVRSKLPAQILPARTAAYLILSFLAFSGILAGLAVGFVKSTDHSASQPNEQIQNSAGSELPGSNAVDRVDPVDPGGPVGPIHFVKSVADPDGGSASPATVFEGDDFSHGEHAVFHGHGDEVCASGCSASRHPTERLSKREYRRLIGELATQPQSGGAHPSDSSLALDTLLFYGRQTSKMIKRYGTYELPSAAVASLKSELEFTHALLSIRVVDESGETRTWLPPTKVPFDRRHVFSMETERLQSLVTSGTVKRVGRDHLWTRL